MLRRSDLARRDLALALVAPVVLVAIAMLQISRAHHDDLSSWKGAGFGMFATYESSDTRIVLAWSDDTDQALPVPDTRAEHLARILPTEANARRVAREVADRAGLDAGTVVRLEVRGIEVEDDDGALTLSPVTLVVVRVEARG